VEWVACADVVHLRAEFGEVGPVQVQTRMSELVRTSDNSRGTHADSNVGNKMPMERCAGSAHVWQDPGPREGRASQGRAAVTQANAAARSSPDKNRSSGRLGCMATVRSAAPQR